jgi:hypothetical protein
MLTLAVGGCSSSSSSQEPAGGAGAAGADGQDAGQDQAAEAAVEASDDAEPEASTEDAQHDAVEEPLPAHKICEEVEPGFNESEPGMSFTFDTGVTALMAQDVGMGAGVFMKAAREDYCKDAKKLELELDTCTDTAAPALLPQCATKADCAAEQDCKPDTKNGQPIAGTERCVTPRQPLDVGPFTVTGFKTGPKLFQHNPQQSGAYTPPGSDGTISVSEFAFDADYTLEGTLDADAGLGAFSGTYHMPAAFDWVLPALVDLPGMPGIKGIEVEGGKDLVMQWTGGDPQGELSMTMNAANSGGKTITCRVKNDGSFTIPAALVDAAKLGNVAFFNALDIRMESKPTQVTGTGITFSRVSIVQARVLNLIKK